MIAIYFAAGIGFYIGIAMKDPKSFVKADMASLLRGLLLGLVAWPLGMVVQLYFCMEEMNQ